MLFLREKLYQEATTVSFPDEQMYLFSVFNSLNDFSWFSFVFPKATCHDFGSVQVCTNL